MTFIIKDAYECGHLLQVSNLKLGNPITLLSDVIIVSIEVKLDRGDDEEMLNYFAQVTESDGIDRIVREHLNQELTNIILTACCFMNHYIKRLHWEYSLTGRKNIFFFEFTRKSYQETVATICNWKISGWKRVSSH